MRAKVEDSEQRLLQDALQLRVHLQVVDSLPSNGVMPVKAKQGSPAKNNERRSALSTEEPAEMFLKSETVKRLVVR